MSKHIMKIKKGKRGKFSKITEEYLELKDAIQQKDKKLELSEIKDLLSAINSYSKKRFKRGIKQLLK